MLAIRDLTLHMSTLVILQGRYTLNPTSYTYSLMLQKLSFLMTLLSLLGSLPTVQLIFVDSSSMILQPLDTLSQVNLTNKGQ